MTGLHFNQMPIGVKDLIKDILQRKTYMEVF